MTAVAQGAAIFAESIDWESASRGRKGIRGELLSSSDLDLRFVYVARTPDGRARVTVRCRKALPQGSEFQISSLDTGWTSGRSNLFDGAALDVQLAKPGQNRFAIEVFDQSGGVIVLPESIICIHRTATTIDAIPASHSIGSEVLDRIGGQPTMEWLIRSGDQLPAKGTASFRSGESLEAGSGRSINFKVWEGEIEDPVSDNRFVGTLKVSGSDFEQGSIPAGAELVCDYEVLDSGNIVLEISVPSIGGVFHSHRNFYTRQDGQVDFSAASARVSDECEEVEKRLEAMAESTSDSRLSRARAKIDSASASATGGQDSERTQEASEQVLEVRRILADVRRDHLPAIRKSEFDNTVDTFEASIKNLAKGSEVEAFLNLARTTELSIDRSDSDFENHIAEMRALIFGILWRQDGFVLAKFEDLKNSPHAFADIRQFATLVREGDRYITSGDTDELRRVVAQLHLLQVGSPSETDLLDVANILRA